MPESLHDNNVTTKVDLNLSASNRFFVLFSHGRYLTDYTGSLAPNTDSMPLPYTQGRIVEENPTTAQVHFTHVFTPTLLNNFSAGFARTWIPLFSATAGGGYPQKAGITGLPGGAADDVFPTVNFAGANAPNVWAGTNAVAVNEAENGLHHAG